MPCSNEAASFFVDNKTLYIPGKAANAGGVAISGAEMSQNSMRLQWTREKVDQKLQEIITSIHSQCCHFGGQKDWVNYQRGANIAGFKKVADTMLSYGCV